MGILIFFMYKIHGVCYQKCCGWIEAKCVQPRYMAYYSCNYYCFKMQNIVNGKLPHAPNTEKENPVLIETVRLDVDSGQRGDQDNSSLSIATNSTSRGNTPRPRYSTNGKAMEG